MAHHRRLVGRFLAAFLLLTCARTWADESTALSREAGDHLLHGNVKAALGLFEHAASDRQSSLVTTPWSAGDAVMLVQALLRQGRFPEAQAVLAARAVRAYLCGTVSRLPATSARSKVALVALVTVR